ncbi:hypothetical protein EJB05_54862, partial [Eragrostis curvula]
MQSLVVAAVAERDISRWKLGLDINLLTVLYTHFRWYSSDWVPEVSEKENKDEGEPGKLCKQSDVFMHVIQLACEKVNIDIPQSILTSWESQHTIIQTVPSWWVCKLSDVSMHVNQIHISSYLVRAL